MKKSSPISWLALSILLGWGCATAPPATTPSAAVPGKGPTGAASTALSRSNAAGPAKQAPGAADATQTDGDDDLLVVPPVNPDETDVTQNATASGKQEAADAADAVDPSDSDAIETKNQPFLDEALEYCQLSQTYWQKGELEKALHQLDHAYALILKVNTDDDSKLMQQKEDLRWTISKRILEIYASRHIVVNGTGRAIPLVMNKYVKQEIKLFAGPEKQFFINSYRRSGRFRPMIVKALQKNGMPVALSWLPLIESGFKMRAMSRARALGLWQFISSTGYKFGLKRTLYIDERLDPEKATDAAISYLKELHSIFGDWTTVLAAYNCGEGRVLQVIRSQNVNYLDNFWDLYERLPMETARYVPRFLAALQIIKDPEKYGFHHLTLDPPPPCDTVTVDRQVSLDSLAKVLGIHPQVLKDMNPELRYCILPSDGYNLRVPKGMQHQLLAKIDTVPLAHLPIGIYIAHRVHSGETLSGIAHRFHTSVRRIKLANGFRSNRIRIGQRLKIPARGAPITSLEMASARHGHTRTAPLYHRVRQGDSLWILARRFGTTTERIRSLNHLRTTRLRIGQVLKIRNAAQRSRTSSAGGSKTYTVRRGDSPYRIAHKTDMPVSKLLQMNGLTANSMIYPGQQLNIE